MPVIQMKKITLIGMNTDKERILRDLAFTGCVEFSEQTAALQDEAVRSLVARDSGDEMKTVLDEKIASLKTAIDALTPHATKRGFFTVKPGKTRAQLDEAIGNQTAVLAAADTVCGLLKKQSSLRADIAKDTLQAASLEPWRTVAIPMSFPGTRFTNILYGTIPTTYAIEQVTASLWQAAEETVLTEVYSDKKTRYVSVLFYKALEDEVLMALREYAFGRVVFTDKHHTVAAEISELLHQNSENKKQIERLSEELLSYVPELATLELLYDALKGEHDTHAAKSRLLVTKGTFVAEGYVPVPMQGVVDEVLRPYDAYIEYAEPPDVEDTPVLLKNGSAAQPYEFVTELYSLPAYGAIDPTRFMAPFFWLFFGMMMADVGYGTLMVLVGLLVKSKLKPSGMMKRIFSLVTQCGISTILCGIVYGSYFGDAISVGSELFTGKRVVIKAFFDPMKDPMTLLIVCIGLGLVHIVVGMGLEAYRLVKEGKPFSALFDIGFWYMVFAGIIAFLFIGSAGLYISAAGALGLVLTQGRSKKNVIAKLFSGLLSLYNITGFFSDILSYSRLLALGLSTAVIASVFNTMGALGGRNIFGFILFIIVFIVGHLFNVALGILGAYVHSSRLQYVEFFGKFYQSGGKPFTPLSLHSKYVHIVADTESTQKK